MSCKTINPKFQTSEASTKSWFRTRELIDKYLNILDLNGFRKANKKWSEYSKKEYNTEGMLFVEENNKALPNKEAFRKIDSQKDITYEQRDSKEESIDQQEFEAQRERLSSLLGMQIVYDDSIPQSATVQGDTITVNPDKLFRDTLVHEVGHVLIDSIGGLDNPMVRRGIDQLKGTAMANDIQEQYSDQPQDIIDKEILATAIGLEGSDIFGNRPDRVSKWKRWLDLFLRRVKQVLGMEPNVARDMAREIIFHNPTLDTDSNQKYERRDRKVLELQDKVREIQANLRAEINALREQEVDNYEERAERLNDLVKRLENTNLEVGVVSYVNIAQERVSELLREIRSENRTLEDLRRIKTDLLPYENVKELEIRLQDLDIEQDNEVWDNAGKLVHDINAAEQIYYRKAKDLLAKKFANSENGRIQQQYREKFQEEFDEKNTESSFLGFRQKRYIDGEQASKGKYNAAKTAYVQQKMEQYRDKIVQEQEDFLLDAFEKTPNDIGTIEYFVFDSGAINDEVVQLVNELIDKAEYQVQTDYLEMERELKDLHDEFVKDNPNPNNQQKKWDFMLADELDENGEPTGNKVPYLKGEINPSFKVHRDRMRKEIDQAEDDVTEAFNKYKENPDRYEQQYKEEQRKLDDLLEKRTKWLKENTIKMSSGFEPTSKWKTDVSELSESQKKMRFKILELKDKIEENYPAAGELSGTDHHIGDYVRIPSVNKTTVEKFTDGNVFENALESFKDIYTPRAEDTDYRSVAKEVTKSTRNNKMHNSLPIYYRNDTNDQSFDVLSAFMMDYYQSLNYKNKRNIESEVIALKDMSRASEVGESVSSIGNGIQGIKNFFKHDLTITKDEESEISNRYKALNALINARMYGVRRKGNDTINKIVDSAISFTSMAIMPANYLSAISNVIVGKSNSAIEIFGDNIPIDKKDFVAAEKEYISNLPGTLGDIGRPKVSSYMSKIMEKYDSMGDFFGPTFRFAEDSRTKQLFKRGTLYALTSMGEHYISGTMTLGALRGMKLQNKQGEYINTEGEVVKDRDNAATMLDYLSIENGEITYNDIQDAYKTDNFTAKLGTQEHDRLTKNYIRNLVAQTQGQYDSKQFSVSELNAFARMFFSLRQWMGRGIAKHWRSGSYVLADEIPEHAKFRGKYGAGDAVGYQTQFFHTSANSVKGLYKYVKSLIGEGERLTFDIAKQPWQDLTPSEKSRIRKAVMTYAYAGMAYAISSMLLSLDDDEEDIPDEVIYLVFALERTKQELLFYVNPYETVTMIDSPAASYSMIKNVMKLVEQAGSDAFSGEFERYQRTERKGEPKIKKQIEDITPVFNQLNRDVRRSLDFIQNIGIR